MQRRPRVLLALSCVLLAIAASLPVQIGMIYGHDLSEWHAITGKLTFLNWAVIFGCIGSAWLVAGASPYCRHAVGLLTMTVAFNNYFVGYYATDFSPLQSALATIGFSLVNFPLYSREVLELYRRPDKRWWRRSARHQVTLPLILGSARKIPLRAESFDISDSGLFIPLSNTQLEVDDRITLRLSFGTFARLRCEGRIVRKAEARGIYPAGVGIEFTGMDWRQKRELRRHLKELSA